MSFFDLITTTWISFNLYMLIRHFEKKVSKKTEIELMFKMNLFSENQKEIMVYLRLIEQRLSKLEEPDNSKWIDPVFHGQQESERVERNLSDD